MVFGSVPMTSSVRTPALEMRSSERTPVRKSGPHLEKSKIRLVSLLGMLMKHSAATSAGARAHRGGRSRLCTVDGARAPCGSEVRKFVVVLLRAVWRPLDSGVGEGLEGRALGDSGLFVCPLSGVCVVRFEDNHLFAKIYRPIFYLSVED